MEDGRVCRQGDSFSYSEAEVIDILLGLVGEFDPEYVVVEDLPHRLPFAALVKAVCRMQGRLVHGLWEINAIDRLVFVPPALWQRHFPGVWRKGAYGALQAAAVYNYQPPDLRTTDPRFSVSGLTGKERAARRAADRKIITDYVDAFLIAMWATETHAALGTLDVPQTQRYER